MGVKLGEGLRGGFEFLSLLKKLEFGSWSDIIPAPLSGLYFGQVFMFHYSVNSVWVCFS